MANLTLFFTLVGVLALLKVSIKTIHKGTEGEASTKKRVIFGVGVLLLAFVIFFGVSYIYENKDAKLSEGWDFQTEEEETVAKWGNKPLTIDNLYEELCSQGLDYPEIVLAQALLETDHFRSYSCRERHNLFGLRKKDGYMEFPHWTYSVAAYKRYIQKYENVPNDYYAYLDRLGYAEDSIYVQKVKEMVRKTEIKTKE